MIDLLLDPLNLVVPVGRPVVRCLLNHRLHILRCLYLVHVEHESLLQILQRFLQKTWQPRLKHLLDDVADVLMILPHNQEALDH